MKQENMSKRTRFSSTNLVLLVIMFLFTQKTASIELGQGKNRCYSCASENMKENFLTRSRGPQGRQREPKLYDSMCDLDSWLIRDKSAVECQGACFKWQQVLNNSGVLSYATIRDCFNRMFDSSAVVPTPSPGSAYTTDCKHVQSQLNCSSLDLSSVEEHTCFCNGDFCNSAFNPSRRGIIFGVALLFLFFLY